MSNRKITDWLPTTRKEAELRGWDELDVVMFSGDAYVDHPSFGAAVICRLLEAEGLRERFVVICGGPRITHELAKELGYDAGFGAGTYGDDVASFAVAEMVRRGMK